MVLLEAMAADLPIICSDCGGGSEIVRGAGELFAFGDADALASCLASAHANQHLDVANIHKKLVESFSDEAAQKQFWDLPFVKEIVKQI